MTLAKKSRILPTSSLLIAVFLLSLPAYAKYSGGTGEPNDPYIIDSEVDLLELSSEPNDYSGHFLLTKDLDLIDKDLMPIGWAGGNEFTGVFDGNDYAISNLTFNMPEDSYVGLFSRLGKNGRIQNLGIEDVNIIGEDRVGALVGESVEGTVSNCYATGVISGRIYVGGMIGSCRETTIRNCQSEVEVNGEHTVGGLAGSAYMRCVIHQCGYSMGSVYGEIRVGGLIGACDYSTIIRCYSNAATIGREVTSVSIGGLVGRNEGSIDNSYATGVVVGSKRVGGLVGFSIRSTVRNSYSLCTVTGIESVGGLVGDNRYTGINNCYSAGVISGNNNDTTGGFIGSSVNSNVSGCYWDIDTSGQNNTAGRSNTAGGPSVIGLNDMHMQDMSIYLEAGWDFINEKENGLHQFWQISDTTGYPVLSIFNGYSPVEIEGIGTKQDPFLISSADQLGSLAYLDSDAHYQLISDVNTLGVNWTMPFFPLFSGVFEGNGHVIQNVNMSSNGSIGIVGQLDQEGIISNLSISDVNYVGAYLVGGLVAENQGEISHCSTKGKYLGVEFVGGLVGENRGEISNCSSEGEVQGESILGMLVGRNIFGEITNSYASGTVAGWAYIGGLAGVNEEGTVSDCYSKTDVTSSREFRSLLGGFVGFNNFGTIVNCYSVGKVSARNRSTVGGFVGEGLATGVVGCFWDFEASGLTEDLSAAGGTVSNKADMQKAITFRNVGWDFVDEIINGTENLWWINEGKEYPRLWWETE